MNPCNPTDPVPVPRSVAERALSDAKMRLRIEKDRAGSGSIISAQYVETYEHDIAALESALAAPQDDGWCYELDKAPLEIPIEVSATTLLGNQILRAICHDDGDGWFYLPDGGGQRLFPYAWRPLPAPAKPKRHRGINAVPDDAWPKCPDGHLESGTAKPKPEVANG